MNHSAARRRTHVVLAVLLLVPYPALAATIVVDQTTCTLVDAITAANSDAPVDGCTEGSGADTIELTTDVLLTEPYSSYNCPRGLPEIESTVTIEGHGFTVERLPAAPPFGLIFTRGVVVLDDLVVRNGLYSTATCVGAGIRNFDGSLTVNSTITRNSAVLGSAIFERSGLRTGSLTLPTRRD